MSLLLDALNRASKDKAAAAAAQAVASPQTDEPTVGASASAAASSQAHSKTPNDAVADLPVLELSLASVVRTPGPADSWQSEQMVPAPDQPLTASFVLTEPIQPAKPTDSSPEPVALAPQTPPPPQPETAPANKPQASGTPRVAQEIVRAKAPAARAKPPLRLVVLGSLAVLLAAGLGSVLMGWWGDPVNWIQSAGLANPSTARPAAPMVASRVEPVSVPPVVSDVPVVSDAPNRPVRPQGRHAGVGYRVQPASPRIRSYHQPRVEPWPSHQHHRKRPRHWSRVARSVRPRWSSVTRHW